MSDHGTWSRWSAGCRCDDCGEAAHVYRRGYLKRTRAAGGLGEHGTRYRYVTGCRCDDCRAANSAYDRVLRARCQSLNVFFTNAFAGQWRADMAALLSMLLGAVGMGVSAMLLVWLVWTKSKSR